MKETKMGINSTPNTEAQQNKQRQPSKSKNQGKARKIPTLPIDDKQLSEREWVEVMQMYYIRAVHFLLIDRGSVREDGRYLVPVDRHSSIFTTHDVVNERTMRDRLYVPGAFDTFYDITGELIPRWALRTKFLGEHDTIRRLMEEMAELLDAFDKHGWMNINTILELVDVLFFARYLVERHRDGTPYDDLVNTVMHLTVGMLVALVSSRDEHTPLVADYSDDLHNYLRVAATLKYAVSRRSVKFAVDGRWDDFGGGE